MIFSSAGSVDTQFVRVTDSNSADLCATVSPSGLSVVVRSCIDCAQQCTPQRGCVGFNVLTDDVQKMCQLFMTVPDAFENRTSCSYYTVSSRMYTVQ